MELDKRKLRILQAIIDDYTLTAVPVGSRTLSKRADFDISSATIRNEMSDLEEMGYLEQPHTSSGRIPSNKAYRLYVDQIMRRARLNEREQKAIRSYFDNRINQIEGFMRQTASALSDITRYTAMVMPPQLNNIRIKRVQLVQLSSERVLLLVVTDTGFIRDVMIRMPEGLDAYDLDRFSSRLSEALSGMRLDQMAVEEVLLMGEQMDYQRSMFTNVVDALGKGVQTEHKKVELSGATNILNHPEYSDVNKAKGFLNALEENETLYNILKKASTLEFSITIGDENEPEELKDCSLVTATYRIGNEPMGSFGVIGPTRMQYGRILSILDYMRLSLSEALAGLFEQDFPE